MSPRLLHHNNAFKLPEKTTPAYILGAKDNGWTGKEPKSQVSCIRKMSRGSLLKGFLGVPLSEHISVWLSFQGRKLRHPMGGVSVLSRSFLGHSIFLCLVPG